MISKVIGLTCLVLLVLGCSLSPEKPLGTEGVQLMRKSSLIERWYFEGRLAFTDGKDSFSASISWRHGVDGDQIELVGPLSQGRVLISVLSDRVIIDEGDARNVYPGDVDDVVSEQLRIVLPFSAMRYWLLGKSDPGAEVVEQEQGFFQNGWLVRYPELLSVDSRLLPKKLNVERDKVRVKLVVDKWELS